MFQNYVYVNDIEFGFCHKINNIHISIKNTVCLNKKKEKKENDKIRDFFNISLD
jgi:hypothetical protein